MRLALLVGATALIFFAAAAGCLPADYLLKRKERRYWQPRRGGILTMIVPEKGTPEYETLEEELDRMMHEQNR